MFQSMKPVYYLAIGILTITAAHTNVTIDLAGWITCVPFLLYLHQTKGIASRLIFFIGLVVAWSICLIKIVTPPMPFAMVFLYAIPISLFHLPGYLLWDAFKKHAWSVLLFPAMMVIMEWIQYTFTPLATWGVAAYTQSKTITLMQSLSLFGLAGLSFLVYWVNVAIAGLILKQKTTWMSLQLPAAVLVVISIFGACRYEMSKVYGHEMIKVAAVGTDSDVAGFPLPPKEKNDLVKQGLFERTHLAAQSGAKMVVWNEASTYILPTEEAAWSDSLSSLANRNHISLVAAYVIPLSEAPARYENKYLFFDPEGKLLYTYHKHQPVPGEPAIKGTEPLQVFDVFGVKTGAVICYDYDFPYLARGYGRLHADLVADPSSDWRGIDPVHTRMASFRAVEQGHSILRSTRYGLSAAITPYGEFAAQMSSFDQNDKIMIAHLPVKRVVTLYALIGDVFVYLCIGFVLVSLVMGFWRVDVLKNQGQI